MDTDADNVVKIPLESSDESWYHRLVIYAVRNPWDFCWYLLLCLSPLFCISAFLSWKLAKALEAQDKEKARRDKKKANLSKVKRGKSN